MGFSSENQPKVRKPRGKGKKQLLNDKLDKISSSVDRLLEPEKIYNYVFNQLMSRDRNTVQELELLLKIAENSIYNSITDKRKRYEETREDKEHLYVVDTQELINRYQPNGDNYED